MAGSNISPRPYRELARVNDGLEDVLFFDVFNHPYAHTPEAHARGGAR